jgi:hypothetical protein
MLKNEPPIKMKTTSQNVLNLVAEYLADPNCRAELWIADCFTKGEVTKDERDEFLLIVLTTTWQRAFEKFTRRDREIRLRELTTWDRPRSGNELEHAAKVRALENLTSNQK